MHKSLIEKVARELNGEVRAIPKGLSIKLVRSRLPLIMEIDQPNERLIKVSAWLQSFPVPEREKDYGMLGFYIGIINSNMTTGKMKWNERGEYGFQSTILFDDDPEFSLRSAVDRTSQQLVTFAPGLKDVRNGESADTVAVGNLGIFRKQNEPKPVSANSDEFKLIARLSETFDSPRERVPGGVALTSGSVRIELTADEAGRFLIDVTGPKIHIESGSRNTINFYPPLVNSNDCFGTVYLSKFDRLASRFDLFFPKGRMPSHNLLGVCVQCTLQDVSCHTVGMQLVGSGKDATSALKFAYSSIRP